MKESFETSNGNESERKDTDIKQLAKDIEAFAGEFRDHMY